MQRSIILILVCLTALAAACSADKESTGTSPAASEPASSTATTTPSGLQYTDLTQGQGEAAAEGDSVDVHYTGWLYTDGKRGMMFDSSEGNDPFPVTIGETLVIKGWTEGLVGMKEGGKRQLIIPPSLAYGATGFPPVIPPDSTLEFEVQVVKLTK